MSSLSFSVVAGDSITFDVQQLVIAGWAGRDAAGVEHHIQELEAIGVKRPATIPCYYPLAPMLLTTATSLVVPRADSSGEVECVLLSGADGTMYVGVGSDHTDRVAEAYDVTVSKQMCAKPVSATLWRFDEVADHWDQLVMRCWRTQAGVRTLYQQGLTASLRDPRQLIERYTGNKTLPAGTAMFCGTQSVMGQLGHGEIFEMELHDPVRDRSLTLTYNVVALDVA